MAITRDRTKSNQIRVFNTPEPSGSTTPIAYDELGNIVDYDMSPIFDIIREPPIYIQPSASMQNLSDLREVGEVISSLEFDIQFNQNDAGVAESFSLSRSINASAWSVISNSQSTDVSNTEVVLGNVRFRGTVNHAEGPTKNNNLGEEDATGKILSGSVNTNISTITGRYKFFFGNTEEAPSDSSGVRSLPQDAFDNEPSIDLITGTTETVFVVAIPNNKSIIVVNDLTNLGADLTEEYVLTDNDFSVNDAGGNPVAYNLYVYSTAIPYNVSATHRIIIS